MQSKLVQTLYCLFLVSLFLQPISLLARPDTDSLYQQSLSYLEKANALEGDFDQVKDLAQQAAIGFQRLKEDSLLLEAKFLIARAAYYQNDSLGFEQEIAPILQTAMTHQDTSAIVRAYNMIGVFYFSQGESNKGMEALRTPDQYGYYSGAALDENITNLGALIDISMMYTRNLDTVYYYVNKLQSLASLYSDPSVQVVSRFKLAQLFAKAYNYQEALHILREAYPYIPKLENKGFSHYYYQTLINSFIQLGKVDSANHYIDVLQEVASYSDDDPRNCYIVISRARANMLLDQNDELPQEFEQCYDRILTELEGKEKSSLRNLEAIYIKCNYLLSNRAWLELDTLLHTLIKYASATESYLHLKYAFEIKYRAALARNQMGEALAAHEKFKEYNDQIQTFTFSQSERLIRNQLDFQLAKEENKRLQVENQNQKLRIGQNRSTQFLYLLGLLLLIVVGTYFIHLARIRSQRSKELSILVNQRTNELKQANQALTTTNQKLIDSNTELERFAYIASHDLKTPLHNIIKFTGLLKEKLPDKPNQEINEYLSFIISGGKQMNTLIEDVLEYSKLSKDEEQSSKTQIDLEQLINDIKNSISEHLHQKGASIEIQSSLPNIHWDYFRIFALCKNLLENGIKYNESEQPIVEISFEAQQTGGILSFKDNGIGVESEFKDKIFQMFTRLHTTTVYEGSGMGLAICQKIVDGFNGQLSVESQVGEGSTFQVYLPDELLKN